MFAINRILVHIDQDADNTQVLQRTAQLASQTQASVELFCAAYNRSLQQSHLFDKKAEQHAEHGYVKSVESKLEGYANQLERLGISCGVDVYWEKTGVEGLMRKALRDQPDLVIYPLRAHKKLGQWLSGDTEQRLIRECPVPLLLTYGETWRERPHIAACVDPFHHCEQLERLDHTVLDITQAFCSLLGSEMQVVHSYHTLPHSVIFDEHVVTDYAALQQKVQEDHRKVLDKLLASYALDIRNSRVKIVEGESHKALPKYARQESIDLMVMGQVAKSPLDRWLTGSTVTRVQHHLECDLLVVKPPGFVCPVEE